MSRFLFALTDRSPGKAGAVAAPTQFHDLLSMPLVVYGVSRRTARWNSIDILIPWNRIKVVVATKQHELITTLEGDGHYGSYQ